MVLIHETGKDDTPRQFFLNLMTCNSLFPVVSEDSQKTLVSESPDETAIADFMGKLGATIEDRDQDSITLNFDGNRSSLHNYFSRGIVIIDIFVFICGNDFCLRFWLLYHCRF